MSALEKVDITEVYWKFHVTTPAKKLFERRIILVQKMSIHFWLKNCIMYLGFFQIQIPLLCHEWLRIPIMFVAKIWRDISEETDLNYSDFYTLELHSSKVFFGIPYCQFGRRITFETTVLLWHNYTKTEFRSTKNIHWSFSERLKKETSLCGKY